MHAWVKELRKGAIGILKVDILGARDLLAMKATEGRLADPYCVAKYGDKWVRTDTVLNTVTPQWNQQFTWDVFDLSTALIVAVFDDRHVGGHDTKDTQISKVHIRLSMLETDRVYTQYYPLVVVSPRRGLMKLGELHLAVRFTCKSWPKMLAMYGKPLLPKMHHTNPISEVQLNYLRRQAVQMVAKQLERAKPPLRREVVEYMLDDGFRLFSMRRTKANWNRITSLYFGAVAFAKWFHGICKWKNPMATILVHLMFLHLLYSPELILPMVFLFMIMIAAWNYRHRPRKPPQVDAVLSCLDQVQYDELVELDEEFDTFPSSRPDNILMRRYDRLRNIAGMVQTELGDLASQGERAYSLLSWRDPRLTPICIALLLVLAVVLYLTPFRAVVTVMGLYFLRHPWLRSCRTSLLFNMYSRLPSKDRMML